MVMESALAAMVEPGHEAGHREALWRHLGRALVGAGLILVGWVVWQPFLVVIPPAWFLPFHTVVELVAVVIACVIFLSAWYQRQRAPRSMLYVGYGFLAVAVFDLGHTLSYAGMPDFITPNSPHKAILLWLLGRYGMVAVFFLAVFARGRPEVARGQWLALGTTLGAAVALTLVVVMAPERFPLTFVAGEGLTPLKIALEWGIVALLAVPLATLWRREAYRTWRGELLMLSIAAMMVSELFFTLYANVTDIANMLGHFYKVLGYAVLCRLIFLEAVRVPYFRLSMAQRKLAEDGRFLENLIRHAPDGVLVSDEGGRIEVANAQLHHDFGYQPGALVGELVETLVPLDVRGAHVGMRNAYWGNPRIRPMKGGSVLYGRHRDGSPVPIEVSLSTIEVEGGRRAIAFVRNVSERHRLEAENRKLLMLLQESPDWVLLVDEALRIEHANPAAVRALGVVHGDASRLDRYFTRFGGDASCEGFVRAAQSSGSWSGEGTAVARDGVEVPVSIVVTAHRQPGAPELHYAIVARDLTERVRWERQLAFHATHDALTGLPNRLILTDRIEHGIHAARRAGKGLAVLFLDLDNFKLINDSLGHAAGDDLLCAVTRRMQASLRQEDTLTRFGGDEFVVLLPGVEGRAGVERVAAKLLEALDAPFTIAGRSLVTKASIGIHLGPSADDDVDAMLKKADQAMYRAKRAGRGCFRFYEESEEAPTAQNVLLLAALREAIRCDGSLALHYQPLWRIANGEVVAVEALVRWTHPELGAISPARFIPLAEESGLISPLGEWVLGEACRQIVRWRADGLAVRVAINVSVHELRQPDFAHRTLDILALHGVAPGELEIEVTETAVMDSLDTAIGNLNQFSAAGVGLALDDFGTGYSSLAYLKTLPVTKLKIDRSFIADLRVGSSGRHIVQSLISLAQSLNLSVVAEGVETEEQRRILGELGCELGQGWLYHRPMPAARCAEVFATQRAAARA